MTLATSAPEKQADLVVLGAGPAGISAAMAAARQGLRTVLVDEAPAPGGQVYRALPAAFRVRSRAGLGEDFERGEALRAALAESEVETALGCRVWNASPGFTVHVSGEDGAFRTRSPALIAATGASERVVPFPGWTTPGVIGLAGATVLLKSQLLLPGRRTVVCGSGPLLYAVAAGIVKGGGEVAAIVDAASRREWLSLFPSMAARVDLAARGARWLWALRKAGVPILHRHAVLEVRGRDVVEEVVAAPVDETGALRSGEARRISADSVAVGHGLIPGTEVSRLLRTRQEYRPERGGWVAERDADGRTSVPFFYVAGDGAGIAGAAAAEQSGAMAGLAAALDLGRIDRATYEAAAIPARRAHRQADRFGRAMAGMMRARPGLIGTATAETVICRCEDVTRATIETAVARGARTLNQLKSWTRCGMGPCQGRFCADAAATLVAARTGDRAGVGQFTARLPLRPLPVRDLVQGFDYRQEVPPPALVPR